MDSIGAAQTVSSYTFKLEGRSHEDPSLEAGTFRMPPGAYIKNSSPSVNERGDVALDYPGFDGLSHVWTNGEVIFDAVDSDGAVGGTSVDPSGNVAFDQMGSATGNGVYLFNAAAHTTKRVTGAPLGATSWININLASDGKIGYRASGGDGSHVLGYFERGQFVLYADETITNPKSIYKYIFGPSFDATSRAAVKVWLEAGGNEIRVFTRDAEPVIVAQERAVNPASGYVSFDNGVSLANSGKLVFIAKRADGKRAVYRAQVGSSEPAVQIAAEGEGGVAKIAFFTPVVNDAGTIVFKGDGTDGKNTLWVGDGSTLKVLATVGSDVPSDKGTATILPETGFDPNNKIAFGGGLAINNHGDVVFMCALAQPKGATTERLGTGLYRAIPSK